MAFYFYSKNSEISIEDQFIRFLKNKKGFYDESLNRELVLRSFVGTRQITPDLAIVDPTRNRLLALIEFSITAEGEPSQDKIPQLVSLRAASLNLRLPVFLVVGARNPSQPKQFRVFVLQKEPKISEIALSDFPTYEDLVITAEVKDRTETSVERNEAVDKFKYFAWCGALAAAVLLILNLFHYLQVTITDLSLLTLAIGLSLLPFAAKMKVLGLEWEPIAKTRVTTRRKRRPS